MDGTLQTDLWKSETSRQIKKSAAVLEYRHLKFQFGLLYLQFTISNSISAKFGGAHSTSAFPPQLHNSKRSKLF